MHQYFNSCYRNPQISLCEYTTQPQAIQTESNPEFYFTIHTSLIYNYIFTKEILRSQLLSLTVFDKHKDVEGTCHTVTLYGVGLRFLLWSCLRVCNDALTLSRTSFKLACGWDTLPFCQYTLTKSRQGMQNWSKHGSRINTKN